MATNKKISSFDELGHYIRHSATAIRELVDQIERKHYEIVHLVGRICRRIGEVEESLNILKEVSKYDKSNGQRNQE